MLCEMCEYARFGENSSRKPKKSTTTAKSMPKSASTTKSALPVRSPNPSADNTKQKSASKPTEAGNVGAQGDATECKFCDNTFPEEDGKLIQCGRCDSGVCVSCSMLDTAMYDLTIASSRGIHWFCKDCDAQAMKTCKLDNKLRRGACTTSKNAEQKFMKLR